ncbi:hypothetical protein DFP73DRAFT_529841 [Morchella snyderi]|nr:hypothetical protein DFP73DRAFT_529841 [Morchella snyderi]
MYKETPTTSTLKDAELSKGNRSIPESSTATRLWAAHGVYSPWLGTIRSAVPSTGLKLRGAIVITAILGIARSRGSRPASEHQRLPRSFSPVISRTPPLQVMPQPNFTALIIEGHKFTTPHDPLQAFNTTRSQTITSFRALHAGTARTRDMSLIFAAVTDPSPTTTTIAATPATDSTIGGVLNFTPPTALVNGTTRDINIENHMFTLPTDPVEAFLAPRVVTVAAFRNVAKGVAGEVGGKDMAFVFGTAAIGGAGEKGPSQEKRAITPRAPRAVVEERGILPPADKRAEDEPNVDADNEDRDGEYITPVQAHRRRASRMLAPSATPASPASPASPVLPVPPAPPAPPPPAPPPARRHSPAPPPPHPAPPLPVAPRAQSPHTAPAPIHIVPNPRHRRAHAQRGFLGNFHNPEHARRELGMSEGWRKGKYVEGFISLGGRFAATREVVGEGKCLNCALTRGVNGGPNGATCRVLVGLDPYIRQVRKKCGYYLQRSVRCDVEGG